MREKFGSVVVVAGAVVVCCVVICALIGHTATQALPWVFAEASANARSQATPATDDAVQAMRMAIDQWDTKRHADMRQAVAGATELAKARSTLAEIKPGIPREVAICFEARAQADRNLHSAMLEGGDLAEKIERYKINRQSIDTFCAYALQIGAPL